MIVTRAFVATSNTKLRESFAVHVGTTDGQGRTLQVRMVGVLANTGPFAFAGSMLFIALKDYVAANPHACFLDTSGDAITSWSMDDAALLIGPEGGWSPQELQLFADRRLKRLKLTDTVLRVETAAIAAAAVIMTLATSNRPRPS